MTSTLEQQQKGGGLAQRMVWNPSREFRLINIYPGASTDPLKLEVFHSVLDKTEPPAFEALSYVWGDPNNQVTVNVLLKTDDEVVVATEIIIGQNLEAALKHLRYADSPRTVWADALCINQRDFEERSQQVLMMGDIYRLAQRVVAFLGPEGNDTSCAIDLIRRIGDTVEVDFAAGLVKATATSAEESGWADMQQSLPLGRQELISIYNFMCRDWFDRLWIRQEIGLGNHRGVLQCGHESVGWPVFCTATFIITRKPFPPGLVDSAQLKAFQDRLKQVDNVVRYAMRGFRLINLRDQIGHSQCSDLRDRIYGILSQLRESDQIGIVPDYTKSVTDVYTDAAQRTITHSGNLWTLRQCELSERAPTLTLPSWVPDFSSPKVTSGIHEINPELFQSIPTFSFMDDDKLLRAAGIYICRVTSILPFDEEKLCSKSNVETVQELRRIILELADSKAVQTAYTTRERFLEACCRTLWIDNFSTRWMPPAPHEPSFGNCLAMLGTLTTPSNVTAELPGIPNIARYLERCRDACAARALFITDDGHFGMGVNSAVVGDEICFLFGCERPMILRPVVATASSKPVTHYRVVSECYLHGKMHGEFILGELPRNLQGLLNANSVVRVTSPGFIDLRTNDIVADLRTEPFLQGLFEKGLLPRPTLEEFKHVDVMDTLTKAGFPLQTFDLV
ncbi:hypothetical protein M426DRAFT_28445 [Hypoxylon sp. CI-4A]|nr:hypothetical protein M426DRAFT_28445 [Hypoxylon sp. CI-4A]